MSLISRSFLTYLILSLTFVKEVNAALDSGNHATQLFVQNFSVSDKDTAPKGITFNNDGTKMYVTGTTNDKIFQYTLTSAFDVSTASFSGLFNFNGNSYSVKFNKDGTKMFTISFWGTGAAVKEFLLSIPFDITSIPGDGTTPETTFNFKTFDNNPYGLDFNNDGTKMFVTGNDGDDINEFSLNVGFDLSEGVNLIQSKDLTHPMALDEGENEPFGIEFNQDGTTMFVIGTRGNDVNQYSLSKGFDISTLSFVGGLHLNLQEGNPSGIAFSNPGLKMFIVCDSGDEVNEYHLKCPFNLIVGNCPSITENKDRTGIVEAQMELANRAIGHSTGIVFNRLNWIRRNIDNQNLSNQNIKLNFSNSLLTSLKEVPISSFKKVSNLKNKKSSNKNYFYWSEGTISLGRVGDSSIASTKEIYTKSLTFGLDKFTDDYSLGGFAFRFGSDDVDVGSAGSNLDSNTYNITYYSTSPFKDDTKYLDKIFGIGKIRSDIITVIDGKSLAADRTGNQIYGTFKIKDEYKRDKLNFIPSGQFDFGHTILNAYKESGNGAIEAEDQHIRTKNIRAAISVVEDLSNDKYTLKRHGKLEYQAELDRSSSFKYSYVGDGNIKFNDTLHTGALHNLNGEIGIDIIFPEHYSVFITYERNHAFSTGYSDNLYIAIGYLPYTDTEYAFSLNGSENLMSKLKIKKNIKGFDLTFNLNDDLTNLGDAREAYIELNKVF